MKRFNLAPVSARDQPTVCTRSLPRLIIQIKINTTTIFANVKLRQGIIVGRCIKIKVVDCRHVTCVPRSKFVKKNYDVVIKTRTYICSKANECRPKKGIAESVL